MEKKIIAFYDLLLYVIIGVPMKVFSIISLIIIFSKDFVNWVDEHWYYLVICIIIYIIPKVWKLFFRYCEFSSKLDRIYFRYYDINYKSDITYVLYFPYTANWKKYLTNIDISWNQNAFISEIKDVEIVKLTKEEKKTKVFHKHLFNKYLKINMKYGNSKYVYIGNYSDRQIKQIISMITKN